MVDVLKKGYGRSAELSYLAIPAPTVGVRVTLRLDKSILHEDIYFSSETKYCIAPRLGICSEQQVHEYLIENAARKLLRSVFDLINTLDNV